MIGVFDAAWDTNYYWNSNGASISVAPAVVTPPAPAALRATPGTGQVSLTWTASAGAKFYNVYRGTAEGAEGTTPIAENVTSTSYTNTRLTKGTAYFYKVAAVNAGGMSPLSNEATATPQ
jgi:fibronectin type 3 domain-containing protein